MPVILVSHTFVCRNKSPTRLLLHVAIFDNKHIFCSVLFKKRKTDFQAGGHLGFPFGKILAICDL